MFLSLYLTYRLLKRFPVAIVAIYTMSLCLNLISDGNIANQIEEGEEENIELIEYAHEVDQLVPRAVIGTKEKNEIKIITYLKVVISHSGYIPSAYHKLFILYQNISIDRQMIEYLS